MVKPLVPSVDNLNAECRVYNTVKSRMTNPKTAEDTRF